jgi:hypothetical protein
LEIGMASAILATSPFLALGALACPVGMGAMMWFMARGARSKPNQPPNSQPATLEDLRHEHERLALQIDGLESDQIGTPDAAEAAAPDSKRSPIGAIAGARDTLRT